MKYFALNFLLYFSLTVFSQTPRMSLYEEFTGETCGPCAAVNPGLNALLLSPTNANKIIPIKWQVPIPFSPSNTWSLYQTNSSEIDWRYRGTISGGYGYPSQFSSGSTISDGVNSAPQGRIDGQHQWAFGASSDYPAHLNNNTIATAQSFTSAFSIEMVHAWNTAKSAVIVTVNITASANFNATGPLVFRCVMVERVIQFSVQPGSNGETKFEDVVIRSFPTLQNGTTMAANWTNGQSQNFVLTCPVPTYIRDVEQISMVGFIQDDGNRKVAQAARSQALYDAVAMSSQINPFCVGNIEPTVSVQNAGKSVITNFTITPYIDGAAGAITTWQGNLLAGASTSLTLNALIGPTVNGSSTFSYVISAINGNDFYLSNNVSKVDFPIAASPAFPAVVEGFSLTGFPPMGWTNANYDGEIGWTRTTQTGSYWQKPMHAAKYDFYNNPNIGDVDELFLPAMDLRGGDAVVMAFDYAYAQRSAQSNDKLQVFASKDCGASWISFFSQSGAALATAQPTAGGAFVPDSLIFDQWKTVILALSGFNKEKVLVKFVVTNDNGNNIFLDNINIIQNAPSNVKSYKMQENILTVYPNPANAEIHLKFDEVLSENCQLIIADAMGRRVFVSHLQKGENFQTFDCSHFPSGIYQIILINNNALFFTKKLSISH
jgi:hypothetical protein